MKVILNLVLLLSFSFSLTAGEDLCCSNIFEIDNDHIEQSASIDQNSQDLNTDVHICENSSHSDKSNNDKHHACIGCSHAPFMFPSHATLNLINQVNKPIYFDKIIFISHPFLDGPYQPPRA